MSIFSTSSEKGKLTSKLTLHRKHENLHFLVIDDDPLVSKFLSSYLEQHGHRCSVVMHSEEVEPWFGTHSCDAAILDLNMPGIDGLTLLKMIRTKNARLPVVVFTGLGYDEEKMLAARECGANGFVSKGLPPVELYSALMRALG